MDGHRGRPCLRVKLTTTGTRGSLCIRGLEGGVCERVRQSVEQGDEFRSLRSGLIVVTNGLDEGEPVWARFFSCRQCPTKRAGIFGSARFVRRPLALRPWTFFPDPSFLLPT